jgi:hypothetical protein
MHYAIYGSLSLNGQYRRQAQVDPDTLIRILCKVSNDVWWDNQGAVPCPYDKKKPEFVRLWLDTTEYIISHVPEGWDIVYEILIFAITPSYVNLEIVRTCLERGLSPNGNLRDRDGGTSHSLLDLAIFRAYRTKEAIKEKEDADSIGSEVLLLDQPSARVNPQLDVWCIIAVLIQYGADIHRTRSEDFDTASTWADLQTPWSLAILFHMETEWFSALEQCGTDVEEYCSEDIRRRRQEIRLRGATRSGVDEQMLELPPVAGLRCRKCRKKYCEKHIDSVFGRLYSN